MASFRADYELGDSMSKKLIQFFAGKSVFLAAAILMMAAPAQAQQGDYHRMAGIADSQAMLAQRMSVEAMLVALDVDQSHNLERLQSSREQFNSAMATLRDGNGPAQIAAVGDPDAVSDFEDSEEAWAAMDAAIADCLTIGTVTIEHVGTIADSSDTLMARMVDLSKSLRDEAEAGESHSMLTVAVGVSNHARARAQEMTKGFLLVAYGHQAERYRYALRISSEDFEAELSDLLDGDFDRLLLPAPTAEIRAQLEQTKRIWDEEYRPFIDQAINGDELDYRMVLRMERVNQRLLQDAHALVRMYAAL